jgi:hypothetical protein
MRLGEVAMKPVMSMFSSAATLEKRKRANALIPFTSRPTKKYPFATPIRPCSVVLWKKRPAATEARASVRDFRLATTAGRTG